jgi:hypothetical protein
MGGGGLSRKSAPRRRAPLQALFQAWIKAPGEALANVARLQEDRWVLWPPCAMIAGAAAYMTRSAEPPLGHWVLALCVAAAASFLFGVWPGRRTGAALGWIALLAAFFAAGFLSAAWRTETVRAPRLAAP